MQSHAAWAFLRWFPGLPLSPCPCLFHVPLKDEWVQGSGGILKIHLPPALSSRPGTSPSLVSAAAQAACHRKQRGGEERGDLTKSKYLWLQIKGFRENAAKTSRRKWS